jgi:hypothetical protein
MKSVEERTLHYISWWGYGFQSLQTTRKGTRLISTSSKAYPVPSSVLLDSRLWPLVGRSGLLTRFERRRLIAAVQQRESPVRDAVLGQWGE